MSNRYTVDTTKRRAWLLLATAAAIEAEYTGHTAGSEQNGGE